ncbi:MAG: hypothetical protein GVY08_12955 [Bacteroidetes bacterium]|nr:hypothetical protein [Bacteroidota bacterium]
MKKSSLDNALDSENHPESHKKEFSEQPTYQKRDGSKIESQPKDDIIDRLFRGTLAAAVAVFLSGLIAGFTEASGQVNDIAFDNYAVVIMTLLLYYPLYKLFTWAGFFRQ